jgi:pimeloyl-ACP methyl ester carboxylesterase
MPRADINGVSINYEILGECGPAMMLSPGGRNAMGNIKSFGERMAALGYRVLLHDRRNCGASDVGFDPRKSEYEIWADDLYALAGGLGMLPLIAGGNSSGARLALLFALRYPEAVRALLLSLSRSKTASAIFRAALHFLLRTPLLTAMHSP